MNKPRVLLVEDNKDMVEIYSDLLDEAGEIEILVAEDVPQAIELMDASPFDLIICDYNLPKKNGSHVLNHNKETAKAPVILCTGGFIDEYDDLKDFRQDLKWFTSFKKPFNPDRFVDCVRHVLSGKDFQSLGSVL